MSAPVRPRVCLCRSLVARRPLHTSPAALRSLPRPARRRPTPSTSHALRQSIFSPSSSPPSGPSRSWSPAPPPSHTSASLGHHLGRASGSGSGPQSTRQYDWTIRLNRSQRQLAGPAYRISYDPPNPNRPVAALAAESHTRPLGQPYSPQERAWLSRASASYLRMRIEAELDDWVEGTRYAYRSWELVGLVGMERGLRARLLDEFYRQAMGRIETDFVDEGAEREWGAGKAGVKVKRGRREKGKEVEGDGKGLAKGPKVEPFDLVTLRSDLLLDPTIAFHSCLLSRFIQFAGPRLSHLSPSHPLTLLSPHLDLSIQTHRHSAALSMSRHVHVHLGPTNSGKTHRAIIALSKARNGIYAGPLRLLAHEIASRFNRGLIPGMDAPRKCDLVTGEEVRIHEEKTGLMACTVEMTPTSRMLDVAVLDEIQMLGDYDRGSAWTRAFLELPARELHVCGEESALDVILALAGMNGDRVTVHRYERLSPVEVAEEGLGNDLSELRRGDCVVTFSRNNIFGLKKQIQETTGLRCAVAYGGLPPEVREDQARRFNEGEVDVLVASDAIGMGLNLGINRVIFESLFKYTPQGLEPLSISQVKQIGGRAGRFRPPKTPSTPSSHESATGPDLLPISPPPPVSNQVPGSVLTLDSSDMPLLRRLFTSLVPPLLRAAVSPSPQLLSHLHACLPTTVSSTLHVGQLLRFAVVASRPPNRHVYMAESSSLQTLAPHLEDLRLTMSEMVTIGMMPVHKRDRSQIGVAVALLRTLEEGREVDIRDWVEEEGLKELTEAIMKEKERVARTEGQGEGESAEGTRMVREGVQVAEEEVVVDFEKLLRAPDSIESRPSSSSSSALSPGSLITPTTLEKLESLHRAVSLYLWLSYRFPLSFNRPDSATEIKDQCEECIIFLLDRLQLRRTMKEDALDEARKRWVESEDGSAVVQAVGSEALADEEEDAAIPPQVDEAPVRRQATGQA